MLQITKYHLHTLELIAYWKYLMRTTGNQQHAEEALFRNLGSPSAYTLWREDIVKFLRESRPVKKYKKDLVLYYVAAGAPIYRTMKSLNTSQATVYKLREELPTIAKRSNLEGFFVDHPEVMGKLHFLLKENNLMDGYYLLDRY